MLRFALDEKRSPSATEGINIEDFFHGHVAVPAKPGVSIDAEERRSKERKEIVAASEKALGGEYEKVTQANLQAYKKEIDKILPDFAKAMDEGLKIKGAVVVYHTFEQVDPSDAVSAKPSNKQKKLPGGRLLAPDNPRRNYLVPLDTNSPKSFTPPDVDGMPKGYILYLGFEFLVSSDGAIHVRLGTFSELSTAIGIPIN
jgi:hypothetical protein